VRAVAAMPRDVVRRSARAAPGNYGRSTAVARVRRGSRVETIEAMRTREFAKQALRVPRVRYATICRVVRELLRRYRGRARVIRVQNARRMVDVLNFVNAESRYAQSAQPLLRRGSISRRLLRVV